MYCVSLVQKFNGAGCIVILPETISEIYGNAAGGRAAAGPRRSVRRGPTVSVRLRLVSFFAVPISADCVGLADVHRMERR